MSTPRRTEHSRPCSSTSSLSVDEDSTTVSRSSVNSVNHLSPNDSEALICSIWSSSVRDDPLVAGDSGPATDDGRRRYLYLRGYDNEPTAARFIARHGVRCPYQNRASGSPTRSSPRTTGRTIGSPVRPTETEPTHSLLSGSA